MNIIEQIKALPDDAALVPAFRTRVSAELASAYYPVKDFKALAESHERLLEEAKVAIKDLDRLGGRCNPLLRAIEQAEKLTK